MNDSEKKETRLFFKRFFLFLLPLALLLAWPLYVLLVSGELASLASVIRTQKDGGRKTLIGFAYNDPAGYYKLDSVLKRNPKVITLGTSRVLQFRSEFFTKSDTFFNAGGVARVEDYKIFLNKIPQQKEPKIVILGLDQYLFNNNYNSTYPYSSSIAKKQLDSCESAGSIFLGSWWKVYRDFFRKKFSLEDLMNKDIGIKKIGLNAIANKNGFRNDGSYFYGDFLNSNDKVQDDVLRFTEQLKEIESKTGRFINGEDVDLNAVKELEQILLLAKDKGIYVIGFLTPYPPAIYKELVSLRGSYAYFFKLEGVLRPIFEKYDFNFYNFSSGDFINSPDSEFKEGLHGMEKTYLRLFIKMVETDKALNDYVDLPYLKEKLESTRDNYEVF